MSEQKHHEKFRNVSQGIQALILSLGLIVGGVWTFYVFKARLQVEHARAELAQLEVAIENSQRTLEAAARGRTSIQLSMKVEQLDFLDGDARLVEILVTAKNVGTRDTMLVFRDRTPLIVRRVQFTESGGQSFAEPLAVGLQTLVDANRVTWPSRLVLFAGDVDTLSFLVRVPRPGVYFVSFTADHTDEDRKDVEAIEGPTPLEMRWATSRYFLVTPD